MRREGLLPEQHRQRIVDRARDSDRFAEVVLAEDEQRELLFPAVALDEEDLRALGRQNTSMKFKIAGPRITMNIAGKMKSTVGKSIFTGAFIARSSAAACRRLRESSPWTFRILLNDIPS
jgi:hypothetical protein